MIGTIRRLVADRYFGFIRSDDSRIDYFFHRDDFIGEWHKMVESSNGTNLKVEFEPVQSEKGPRASQVRLI